VRISDGARRVRHELRTFGTMTHQLEELRAWLAEQGVTHVAMESTGVYWRCVYAVLEEAFELIVGNAHHIRNVPGRKTDMKDATWIAELLSHGLIRPSFVPPKPLRELRELTRYRRRLSELQAADRNRLIKFLESANLKLASVLSDVFGVSGRDILRALIQGQDTPETMAELARGRLRVKRDELPQALRRRLDETQRFLLQMPLQRVEATERQIAALDARIEAMIAPYRVDRDRLAAIPGLDAVLAAALIAEVGIDMSVFQSADHLAAWGGACPGSHESAGRRKWSGTRQGNVHLTTIVYSAAQTGVRTKGSYFRVSSIA
jgi:transposase